MADEYELRWQRLLDEKYPRPSFYGRRTMTVWLRTQGRRVNRKRVQRLRRVPGLVARAPDPTTRKKPPQHTVYPYLLSGLSLIRSNQVGSTDNLRAVSAWLCVAGGAHRRVQPQGLGRAGVEHAGRQCLGGVLG
jgi:hypothetical protein